MVPLVGLAYTAIADLGPTKDGAGRDGVGRDGVASASPTSGESISKRTGALNPIAAACCKAIEGNAKSAPPQLRSAYLDAQEACESASSPIEAREKARALLSAASLGVPKACESR